MDVIISNIALPIFEYQCMPRCIRDYSFYILPSYSEMLQYTVVRPKGEKIKNKFIF